MYKKKEGITPSFAIAGGATMTGFERRVKRLREHVLELSLKENLNLEEKTVKELRGLAKEKEIEGYSDMKKDELIKALKR